MAVGRDDADVTDAYISAALNGPSETQITAGTNFFVNVTVEAGTNAIANGDFYTIRLLLQEITGFTTPFTATFTGNLAGAAATGTSTGAGVILNPILAWNVALAPFTFGFQVPGVNAVVGQIYTVRAIVTLGVTGLDIDQQLSEIILVTK